ncbi:MAG: hypothetical protein ACRDWI_06475 [Jiangellaceae bacterium]
MGVTVQRARLAARIKHQHDPDSIDEARRDLKAAMLADDLRRVVDEIPHDPATLDRVAAMLAASPPITTSQREAAVRLLARRTPDDREAA